MVGHKNSRVGYVMNVGHLLVLLFRALSEVPIQFNKNLAYSDGMRVVEPAKLAMQIPTDGLLFTGMDK
ncbi:Bifunctional nuclease 2 [Acorus calamus]|uniref:Bifunctional nuclease 2 n=1 Tax=Acorus calamus TaxID=4465 RepID=A0AAV9DIF5_ACOCL|nr:Bifunctional nuclease 2 [Acorus calamus]